MQKSYSLFREKGRAKPTIPKDIISSKDLDEGDSITWKVVGSKIKLHEGDEFKIHHPQRRYTAYCPPADQHDAFKDAEKISWGWDGNGVPYFEVAEEK